MLSPRRLVVVVASLITLVLVVGGVTWATRGASEPDPQPTASPTVDALPVIGEIPKDLRRFYEQEVEWTPCGEAYECARVEVPMDHSDPTGATISLAVKRLPAADQESRIGSLVTNPGGPGGSGVAFMDSVNLVFSPAVLGAYDVVGFDPRGVGQSQPVDCLADPEVDAARAAVFDTSTPEGRDALRAFWQKTATACEEKTGELLGFVDTTSVVRDLDVLRAVLGDAQLDYLGFSYGTAIGADYAEMFPERVGRLVLDGAMDPALGYTDVVYGQAEAFEKALRSYVASCQAGPDCPLTTDVDTGVGQVQRFLELLAGSPLQTTTADRPLTQSLALSGILLPLYSDAYWPILTQALTAAMQNQDGSQLLYLADLSADREPEGIYSNNSWEAITAVSCLDYPVNADPAAMDAEAERLRTVSPTFGRFLAYGEIACDEWPVPATGNPSQVSAEGAAPILVIGTTGDPATPYPWAQSLAGQLDSGVLLTFQGEGHTAYGRSNDCIQDAVDVFLLRGDAPEDGTVC